MKPSALSFAARASLCLAFFVLASAARCDIKIDGSVGFDNIYRPDAWNPATLTITGNGMQGAGELQLLISAREGVATYSIPLRFHPGPMNERHTISFFYPSTSPVPTVLAQVLVDGRKVAEKKLDGALSMLPNQPAIVGLTQDRSGLSYLAKVDMGRTHFNPYSRSSNPFSPWNGANAASSIGPQPARLLYPAAGSVPDDPFGFSSVDAVMLGDLPLDSLTEDQWNSLVRWVKDGGLLVVSGGADLNRVKSPQLASLLPITPVGERQWTDFSSLAQRYDRPVRISSSPVIVGTATSDSTPLCRAGTVPLVSYKRVGNGRVVFTAFDLTAPEFRSWDGQAALWQELLHLGVGEIRASEVLKQSTEMSYTGSYRSLADALAGIQSTDAPSFTFIGLFLLIYIIFLVPVNYLLLRRWDRKELAWVTSLVIILVFSTGAYAIGYSVKGGQLFLRYGSVVEGTANTDGFDCYTIASIFSPRQTRYDLSVPDSNAVVSEVTLDTSAWQRPMSDISVEQDKRTTVKDSLVNMWDHRNYAFESHLYLGGAIAASAVPSQSAMKVQVSNDTKYTLNDCVVSYRGQYAGIGSLAPGQHTTAQVNLVPSGSGSRTIGPVAVNPGGDSRSTAAAIKSAMAAALSLNEGGSVPGTEPLLFTGWVSDPISGVAIDREHPNVEGTTLIAVHIPPAGSGGATQVPVYRMPRSRQDPFAALPGMANRFNGAPAYTANYYNTLAYQYVNQGQLAKALAAAQQAHNLAPQDGNICDTVGEMYQRQKKWSQAAAWYVKALNLEGSQAIPETHAKYGLTLLALGKKNDAISHLQAGRADSGQWGTQARQALQKLGIQ